MTRKHRRGHVVIWGLIAAGVVVFAIFMVRDEPLEQPSARGGSPQHPTDQEAMP